MDPLSAFRSMMSPQLRGLAVPDALPDPLNKTASGGAKSIPDSELGQLGAPAMRSLAGPARPDTFSDTLHQFVSEVNEKQSAAGAATKGLMSGNGVSLQQAMVAMEEASVSFQLMVEVRNKLLESYQELMRMQV